MFQVFWREQVNVLDLIFLNYYHPSLIIKKNIQKSCLKNDISQMIKKTKKSQQQKFQVYNIPNRKNKQNRQYSQISHDCSEKSVKNLWRKSIYFIFIALKISISNKADYRVDMVIIIFRMETLHPTLNIQNQFPILFQPLLDQLQQPNKPLLTQGDSEQESFQPEYHQIKRLGLKVNKKRIATGAWNSWQNFIYLQFMCHNAGDFLSEKKRRSQKVFYRLSKILKRRTPDQCRSHHQKLQLKYKDDLTSIMSEVYKKIQKCMAQEYVNEQHRIQMNHFQMMMKIAKTGSEPQKCETLVDEGWYNIKIKNQTFTVKIDSQTIKEW